MSILKKIFRLIDLYGLSIPLRYHQKAKFDTIYGTTLSLLTILGVFYVILNFTIKILIIKNYHFYKLQNKY